MRPAVVDLHRRAVAELVVLHFHLHGVAFVGRHKSDITFHVLGIVAIRSAIVVEHQAVFADGHCAVVPGLQVTHVLHRTAAFGIAVGNGLGIAAQSNTLQCGIDSSLDRSIGFDVCDNEKSIVVFSECSRCLQCQCHLCRCGSLCQHVLALQQIDSLNIVFRAFHVNGQCIHGKRIERTQGLQVDVQKCCFLFSQLYKFRARLTNADRLQLHVLQLVFLDCRMPPLAIVICGGRVGVEYDSDRAVGCRRTNLCRFLPVGIQFP